MVRCPWPGTDPEYIRYHDEEWGVPVRDDGKLFELLILEGIQAGLSWITVLKRREAYREALEGFDPERMARYTAGDLELLLKNPRLIRNRRKMAALVGNSRAYLRLLEETGSFSGYLWGFTGGKILCRQARTMEDIPAFTGESEALSRDLKKRGFSFCGPTIVYALMQSAGLYNDHLTGCFRYRQILEVHGDSCVFPEDHL